MSLACQEFNFMVSKAGFSSSKRLKLEPRCIHAGRNNNEVEKNFSSPATHHEHTHARTHTHTHTRTCSQHCSIVTWLPET